MVLKKRIRQIGEKAFWVFSVLYIGVNVARLFVVSSYVVPTESMMPTIMPGDYIMVSKTAYGPRFFMGDEIRHGDISRLGSCRSVERGDVVVFNNPFPKGWKHLRFDVMKYYVKRCIGLPGDTIEIVDSKYHVRGEEDTLGLMASQILLSRMTRDSTRAETYGISMRTYPRDRAMGWDLRNFGPLYIPARGDSISLSHETYVLYGKLIGWEIGEDISEEDGRYVTESGREVSGHVFESDYFFMAGDNTPSSLDSRYWGLVPDEFIAGKVKRVWWSRDRDYGKTRWERIWKKI